MTNPLDSYTKELGALTFSDEAKSRMAERIAAATEVDVATTTDGTKVQAQAEAQEPQVTTVAQSTTSTAQVLQLPTKRQAKRAAGHAWYKVAASVAVAFAVVVGGGTAAVAAGIIPPPSEVFSDIFFSSSAKTEIIDKIGHPLDASCASNGVTITAEAVIGDAYNYTVVFSISKDDGSALDVGDHTLGGNINKELRYLSLGTSDIGVTIDGVDSSAGDVYFYDADPDDNAIQLVWQMRNDLEDTASLIGRTAHFHMTNLVRYDYSDGANSTEQTSGTTTDSAAPTNETVLAEGSWDIDFELNYEDTSTTFAEGVTTTFTTQDEADLTTGAAGETHAHSVTINKATVSYVGITVNYTFDDLTYDEWMAAWDESHKVADEWHIGTSTTVWDFPIVVTLTDGTVIDISNRASSTANNARSSAEATDSGLLTVTKGCSFDRIIETDEIASITLGDTTIDMGAISE